jgi:DHA1 family bicyclomycin/chloramphenicol resistance-like MFS transporter
MSAAEDSAPTAKNRLSRAEFIALMGTIFATVAFSIDAMLPALPEIAAELTPEDANRAQLILTSFVLGMGIGTLRGAAFGCAGPQARDPDGGCALPGGCGPRADRAVARDDPARPRHTGHRRAGPRVVSLAMIRDLYSGRAMAQIVSYAMLIFTSFPPSRP